MVNVRKLSSIRAVSNEVDNFSIGSNLFITINDSMDR